MAEAKPGLGRGRARPLSPHLQIYALSSSMVMSILHRLTGAALYFGTLLLALWLIAAAAGPEAFALVGSLFGSTFGRLILIGYTWALFHHMFGGVRHFLWDTGLAHDLKSINLLSLATAALSVLATAIVWTSYYSIGPGAPLP